MLLILNAIIPIAIVVVIGMALVKWNFVSEQFFSELSKVVFKVFVPVFLFVSVYRAGLQDVSLTLVAYFVPVIVMFVIYALVFNHRIALTTTFSNGVLVGIPVIVAIAGDTGLSICLAVISVHSLILFTTFYLFSSKVNVTPSIFKSTLNIFSNPVVVALLLGLAFKYLAVTIPQQLFTALDMIASAALPLALIILGSSLVQISGFNKSIISKTLLVSSSKLLILPLLVFAFSQYGLQLDTTQVFSLTVLAACPTGISVMPFVDKVEPDRSVAHNTIALSTLLSLLTIPTIIFLLQGY
ncbi:MAG: AEC family transporter [Kangiellaceae bacterium]|nr:AEC family transporter [Kangiellaceae bacterium]